MSGSPKMFHHGSITELFGPEYSAVILMDYDMEQRLRVLGLGQFSVNLIVHTASPIIMTVCTVDGFQWPLTKDTATIRIAKRSFIIALPGLLYGLQFPGACQESHIDTLERVFLKFGHYQDLAQTDLGYPCADNEPCIWNMMRPLVQDKAHEILSRFGHQPGRSRFSVPNHNSCFLRAIRMSATTKLIVESVTSGALGPAHISIRGTINPPTTYNIAYASVSVFTCLVDAVEAAWLISIGLGPPIRNTQPPLQTYPHPGFKVWRLNEQGLVTFIRGLKPDAEQEEDIILGTVKERGETSASASDKGKQIKP